MEYCDYKECTDVCMLLTFLNFVSHFKTLTNVNIVPFKKGKVKILNLWATNLESNSDLNYHYTYVCKRVFLYKKFIIKFIEKLIHTFIYIIMYW